MKVFVELSYKEQKKTLQNTFYHIGNIFERDFWIHKTRNILHCYYCNTFHNIKNLDI
jgi:hypothetical protein